MGSQCSGGTKLQPPLSTAMFYCYNYNILTVYNKEHPPVGTQPQPFRSGPTWPNSTRIQEMLWNRETLFKWNCRAFGSLKLETKPVTQLAQQPCHSTISVDSMAQNYHQNPHSQKRNLQQMRARVIFRLVWDFRARPFSLFLGSFLGAKKARFLTWPQKRGFPTPHFLFRAPDSDAQKTAQTHPCTRFAPVGEKSCTNTPPPSTKTGQTF